MLILRALTCTLCLCLASDRIRTDPRSIRMLSCWLLDYGQQFSPPQEKDHHCEGGRGVGHGGTDKAVCGILVPRQLCDLQRQVLWLESLLPGKSSAKKARQIDFGPSLQPFTYLCPFCYQAAAPAAAKRARVDASGFTSAPVRCSRFQFSPQ